MFHTLYLHVIRFYYQPINPWYFIFLSFILVNVIFDVSLISPFDNISRHLYFKRSPSPWPVMTDRRVERGWRWAGSGCVHLSLLRYRVDFCHSTRLWWSLYQSRRWLLWRSHAYLCYPPTTTTSPVVSGRGQTRLLADRAPYWPTGKNWIILGSERKERKWVCCIFSPKY